MAPRLAAGDTLGTNPATGEPVILALADARKTAFQRNWDLLAAKSGIDAAQAQVIVAREFPNPTASLSTFKIAGHDSATVLGNGFWARNYDTLAAVSQLIEIGGKRRDRQAAARAGVLGAQAAFLDARRLLDQGVTKAYVAAVLAGENARRTAVKFSVRGRDLGSLIAEATEKVGAEVKLPTGYRLEWTGAFENQQRAMRRLEVIVPITLTAIFFLLFVAFDSSWMAFLILLNAPFAAVGGIFALPLAGLNLSVSALVGFVALFGIAMLNGVILIGRIRELRCGGRPMMEAVREGAMSRARPVVMTALMAALGLLPMALSTAVGAETSRPFAVVIIGGLMTATLVTLLILPLLYPWFEPEKSTPGENGSLPETPSMPEP